MFYDIQSTIDIAYNHKIANGSKHIDVTYQWVRDHVELGRISLHYIELGEYLADFCTTELSQLIL
jgi:hypothetical protein